MNELIARENVKAATGTTRANTLRVVPNILRNIAHHNVQFIAGHGSHMNTDDYFQVPDGKYVIFFSSPGVSLSEDIIKDAKFQTLLKNPLKLSQFLTGELNRNNIPNSLRYSRTNFNWKKTLYTPRTSCPNTVLQFWDGNGTGPLQRYMGVWKLPYMHRRVYVNKIKTLRDIVTRGPAGVYFVYACRITPGCPNWTQPTHVYNMAKRVLPNLQNYTTYLNNRMNTPNQVANYITLVRARLQNIGRSHLVPVTGRARSMANRESSVHRMLFKKRVRNSNSANST